MILSDPRLSALSAMVRLPRLRSRLPCLTERLSPEPSTGSWWRTSAFRVVDFKTGQAVPADLARCPRPTSPDGGLYGALQVIFPGSACRGPALHSGPKLLRTAVLRTVKRSPHIRPTVCKETCEMATKTVTDQSFQADVLGADKSRARRFLGGMVRPVPDDRSGARGNFRRAWRQGYDCEDQHRREPGCPGPLWRSQASRPCCSSRTARPSHRRSAPLRVARSSSGWKAT